MKKSASPQPPDELSFEQALDELDALVRKMESGELGLDESIEHIAAARIWRRYVRAG